ncbi:DEAD/DEAH box helicase family protein [Leeia sp. TBRC 13508]|uniref:DEAD/DEAH box helicase family protein n=1 Tax=Leeia speluncae TaxID=2884804 RepID=A0ABS8DA40_9NEIS|nr:DEAD/DEAH box helicase family protein [Leeia speluncae]MCB6185079.1 DEAD/DEAH box helicase family protein [Leeia speluncae]
MLLRKWQSTCIAKALKHYQFSRHFLCLATPGAGKTTMAAELAFELYRNQQIDFVLSFSPSLNVSSNIAQVLERRFGRSFNGQIGSLGACKTYHALLRLDEQFYEILTNYRVLVIFDEIHHCAGDSEETANAWGRKILNHLSEYATFTLALTGTPWRSNQQPITLAQYCELTGKVICDFEYGLAKAVQDKVCRIPNIVLIDNEMVSFQKQGKSKVILDSLSVLLGKERSLYRGLLHHEEAMQFMLGSAINRLRNLRLTEPSAGGLIVASSVRHARRIADVLISVYGTVPELVTYEENDAQAKISRFRHSTQEWIVSVGMISEGTDIPRLQVCCHFSTVKTELYYRQVLGRVLRQTSKQSQTAWLYTFAEPQLVKYAHQIQEDLPQGYEIVSYENKSPLKNENGSEQVPDNRIPWRSSLTRQTRMPFRHVLSSDWQTIEQRESRHLVNVTGKFHEKVLIAFESPF